VAVKALTTKRAPTGEAVDFALAIIAHIKDEKTKQKTQELFDSVIRMYQGGDKIEGPLKTTSRQIYENMATGLGVDLADSADPISRLVQIGIADLDPSRILVNCKHIFATFGARGIAQFKERFCDSCSDCSPRTPSWKYSDEWQEEENKRHVEYMKGFARRTG
jgi:hypothetical protein